MSVPDEIHRTIDADLMGTSLAMLGRKLEDRAARVDLAIYGGSALLLYDDIRTRTRDVDCRIIRSDPASRAALEIAAAEVAAELDLPPDWLSDDVGAFSSDDPDYHFVERLPRGGSALGVFVAAPDYILASKILHMRSSVESRDAADLWALLDFCGVDSEEGAMALVDRYYGAARPGRRRELILADIFEARAAKAQYSSALAW